MTEFTHSRRAQKAIARIEKAHRLGEPIEAVFLAQRWRAGLQVLLFFGALGDVIFVLVARPYWVAATASRVYMFRAGRFLPKAGAQVFEVALDTARVEKLGGGPLRRRILIRALGGAEQQVSVHRMYWKELDRLSQLIGEAIG